MLLSNGRNIKFNVRFYAIIKKTKKGDEIMKEEKKIFDFIADMGETMLLSGGEVYRTEDLMLRLASFYHIEEFNCFILANGIFISAVFHDHVLSKVLHVPISPMHLTKIDAVNTLSRSIIDQKYTLDEARIRLIEIQQLPEAAFWKKAGAYMIGSACFCYLVGGTLVDAGLSLFAGALVAIYFLGIVPFIESWGKAMIHIIASALVTLYACILTYFFPQLNMDTIIVGGVISLVPGVALIIGFRNLFNNDLSSGLIRLTDAVLTALCLSVGVGGTLRLWEFLMTF